MNESLKCDTSELSILHGDTIKDRPNYPANVALDSGKSGSFDAEFELLETTLSELKNVEHDSKIASSNYDKYPITQNCTTLDQPLFSDTTLASSVLKYGECSDVGLDVTNPRNKYSVPTILHSKSISHQGDTVLFVNNPGKVFSSVDNDSCETEFELKSCCSSEPINKPFVNIELDHFNTVGSDTNECDRQPSLSLQCLELVNRELKCSVSLSSRGEKLCQTTKHSNEGCELNNTTNYDISKSLVNSLNSSECKPEIVVKMGDAGEPCADLLGQTHGPNNDVTKDNEMKSSEVFDFSKSENMNDTDANNEQEDHEPEFEIGGNTENDNKSKPYEIATPEKLKNRARTSVDSLTSENGIEEKNPVKQQEIFYSTPNVTKKLQEDLGIVSSDARATDFGLVSPLEVKCVKGKQNLLKRKLVGLQPIEEIDEDTDGSITEKKIKVVKELDTDGGLVATAEASSSTLPCYEAPAKSLLKKWQPSCLSRNVSATSFIVLDEIGETEVEDCSKLSQDHDTVKADDFEIACQSLTEELMKSSSNIETLEKYHSQVQLENQMDDEKFDEILKELTMNVDFDDETCLSLKSMDESTINELDKTIQAEETIKGSIDVLPHDTDIKVDFSNKGPTSENNAKVIEDNNATPLGENDVLSSNKPTGSIKAENSTEVGRSNYDNESPETLSNKDKPNASDEGIQEVDEEDFLLDENIDTQDKPYEFFEFVSSDPKENEDNYNPEWQKLGRLTSDEERYKAVRDRWRSLVPPDPNRNLTYRQWRARNNKSPIKLAPLNNNHQMMDDNEKNQLCTAVFDNKIKSIVQDLEDSRMNIYRQRNGEFEDLGHAQDQEQMRATMSGFSYRDMAMLHSKHLQQCRAVKSRYDQELKRIQDLTEGKIQILREAKEEVLLFQKFYKGVGARDDNEMYMTDIQVQELMETEEMLEQYKVFYK